MSATLLGDDHHQIGQHANGLSSGQADGMSSIDSSNPCRHRQHNSGSKLIAEPPPLESRRHIHRLQSRSGTTHHAAGHEQRRREAVSDGRWNIRLPLWAVRSVCCGRLPPRPPPRSAQPRRSVHVHSCPVGAILCRRHYRATATAQEGSVTRDGISREQEHTGKELLQSLSASAKGISCPSGVNRYIVAATPRTLVG